MSWRRRVRSDRSGQERRSWPGPGVGESRSAPKTRNGVRAYSCASDQVGALRGQSRRARGLHDLDGGCAPIRAESDQVGSWPQAAKEFVDLPEMSAKAASALIQAGDGPLPRACADRSLVDRVHVRAVRGQISLWAPARLMSCSIRAPISPAEFTYPKPRFELAETCCFFPKDDTLHDQIYPSQTKFSQPNRKKTKEKRLGFLWIPLDFLGFLRPIPGFSKGYERRPANIIFRRLDERDFFCLTEHGLREA